MAKKRKKPKKRASKKKSGPKQKKQVCSQHDCNKKTKLEWCPHCEKFFCKEHIAPKLPKLPKLYIRGGGIEDELSLRNKNNTHACPDYYDYLEEKRQKSVYERLEALDKMRDKYYDVTPKKPLFYEPEKPVIVLKKEGRFKQDKEEASTRHIWNKPEPEPEQFDSDYLEFRKDMDTHTQKPAKYEDYIHSFVELYGFGGLYELGYFGQLLAERDLFKVDFEDDVLKLYSKKYGGKPRKEPKQKPIPSPVEDVGEGKRRKTENDEYFVFSSKIFYLLLFVIVLLIGFVYYLTPERYDTLFGFDVTQEPIPDTFGIDVATESDTTEISEENLEITPKTYYVYGEKYELLSSKDITDPTDQIKMYYSYYSGGRKYSIDVYLQKSLYLYFQRSEHDYTYFGDLPSDWESQYYQMFFKNNLDEDALDAIIDGVNEITENDEKKTVLNLIKLVQGIEYDHTREDSTTDIGAYYPYETIYLNKAVCIDKSILLIKLLDRLGYESVLLIFDKENHAAVGVVCPSKYANYMDKYCYVESTLNSDIDSTPFVDSYPVIVGVSNSKASKQIDVDTTLLLSEEYRVRDYYQESNLKNSLDYYTTKLVEQENELNRNSDCLETNQLEPDRQEYCSNLVTEYDKTLEYYNRAKENYDNFKSDN